MKTEICVLIALFGLFTVLMFSELEKTKREIILSAERLEIAKMKLGKPN